MVKSQPVYLDYCASAPIKHGVWEVTSALLHQTGNASSIHGFGRGQRQQVDMARQTLAQHFAVKPQQVIFTSGATEANNMAIHGTPYRSVIVSSLEHPSILNVVPEARQIKATTDGVIDLGHLEDLLKISPSPALVCVMLVNNETGVIQPVGQAAALAHNYGAKIHCDAVAGLGRLAFTFADLGVDSLSICAHKVGGPQGVGALIVREGHAIQPLLIGGGQEMRQRAGTENVAAIAGFAEALRFLEEDMAQGCLWLSWRSAFEAKIMSEVPDAVIFGKGAPRAANIISLAMPGVSQESQLMTFDLAGFAVSAGSACSSGKVQPSPVLLAMGAGPLAAQTIRVSFGWSTSREDLDNFANCWIEFYRRSRQKAVAA
jgi:cysteine desulfurase